jgi:cation-transporting P-type ATPase J
VADAHPLPASGLDSDAVLGLAAAAERPSEHPLARAIVVAAHDRNLRLPDATGFSSAPGRGVTATVQGRVVRVGSPVLLTDPAIAPTDQALGQARAAVAQLEASGRTAAVVLLDNTPVGVLGLTDRLRPDASATVAALTALTGTTPVLLNGDNPGDRRPPGRRGRDHRHPRRAAARRQGRPGRSPASGRPPRAPGR